MDRRFKDAVRNTLQKNEIAVAQDDYPLRIVWLKVFSFSFAHLAALYGAYLSVTSAKLYTTIFAYILADITNLGITAGAHRLWSHRSYKATWQLEVLLMILNTMAFQESVIQWSRDHRLHHKYSETNADPHNAKRGFFFAHVGWLLCTRHPQVSAKGRRLDISDLEENPILVFQQRYYDYLVQLLSFVLPTVTPVYLWCETCWNAFFVAVILRYVYSINMTFLVNSAVHIFDEKRYDKPMSLLENELMDFLGFAEGWHCYHHVFPWDYKRAELGNFKYNLTTVFIDFFALVGWAYDLKIASLDNVRNATKETATDDSLRPIWGWGDKDQCQEECKVATILYPRYENDQN